SSGFLCIGDPYPPPPAVCKIIVLFLGTIIVTFEFSSCFSPCSDIILQEEFFPPKPPNKPHGCSFCLSDISVTVNPSSKIAISLSNPNPPRYLPAPPLPSTNPYLFTMKGKDCSITSTGVLRVLVIFV